MNHRFPFLGALPLALLLSGCAEGEELVCPVRPVAVKSPSISEPAYCQSFTSTLVIKNQAGQEISEFLPGQAIFFESRVTNNGSSAVTLTQADGCPQIRFEVYNDADAPNIVWGSLDGTACTQALTPVTFAPGETKVFPAQWDQALCDHHQAPAGQYTVRTQDSTECWAHIDTEASFTLQ